MQIYIMWFRKAEKGTEKKEESTGKRKIVRNSGLHFKYKKFLPAYYGISKLPRIEKRSLLEGN